MTISTDTKDNNLNSNDSVGKSSGCQRVVSLGLIGRGIQKSKSPDMHHSESDFLDIKLIYKLFDFDAFDLSDTDLPGFINAARLLQLDGLNITHPFKQAVIPLLDDLCEDANLIGAVNTVINVKGKFVGHNTDAYGFAENFRQFMPGASVDVVTQIGAGGAGAATATAIMKIGCKRLNLFDTNITRSSALADRLRSRFPHKSIQIFKTSSDALLGSQGLINATPIGMTGYEGMPVSVDNLRPEMWIADIVYFPVETELIRNSKALGCRTLTGAGMAAFQAAQAFTLFTGKTADGARMLKCLGAINT